MKQAFRHIIIFLLTAIVTVSSTGLSVHRLFCYCKGEIKASIFRPEDPCGMVGQASEKTACCKGGKCGIPEKKDRHDCSDCTSEYVKLDVKYLVFTTDFQLIAQAANLPAWSVFSDFTFFETTKITWEQDIPPPAGKELLPWIQSFLC